MGEKPECSKHDPQATGHPWEHPRGLVTWCPVCGVLEMNGQYMGKAKPDPDDAPDGWLFQAPTPLNWISVTVGLPKGAHLTDGDLAEIVKAGS